MCNISGEEKIIKKIPIKNKLQLINENNFLIFKFCRKQIRKNNGKI